MPSSYKNTARRCDGRSDPDPYNVYDSICSMKAYLLEAGWSNDPRAQWLAIYAYNHDPGYVAAVLKYMHLLRKRIYDPLSMRAALTSGPAFLCRRQDSNLRPWPYESPALTTELRRRCKLTIRHRALFFKRLWPAQKHGPC